MDGLAGTVTPEEPKVRLDLGCGKFPAAGFEGVDLWPQARHVVNLLQFPWPFESDSVGELRSHHFIEHIPMAFVGPDGKTYRSVPQDSKDQDLFYAFFDECWRILKPGCIFRITCPNARSDRAFQDATHRRFIVPMTFMYLNKNYRQGVGVDHYNIKCNFDVKVSPNPMPRDFYVRHAEFQSRRLTEYWNVVDDWKVDLTAFKGEEQQP